MKKKRVPNYKRNNSKYIKPSKTKKVKYIENIITKDENTRVVEIMPKIDSLKELNEKKELDFDTKVEILAEQLKQEILQLYKEGNSVRFIGNKVGVSRELARQVIKGNGSLKITAMQRIRMQEIQQMKF